MSAKKIVEAIDANVDAISKLIEHVKTLVDKLSIQRSVADARLDAIERKLDL